MMGLILLEKVKRGIFFGMDGVGLGFLVWFLVSLYNIWLKILCENVMIMDWILIGSWL